MNKLNTEIENKILEGLNPEQKKAVKAIDGNLEIVACAGAGKTKTITLRIIYMIASGIKPENIVAITFTRKAAEEMRSRIYAAGERILGNTIGFADMYIGTIDAFCLKMLQDLEAEKYAKFSVLDEIQTKIFLERFYAEAGLKGSIIDTADNLNQKFDPVSYSYYSYESLSKKIDIYSNMMAMLNSSWYDRTYRDRWSGEAKRCLDKYNRCLRDNKYFDFSGLLREMIELLDPSSDTNNGRQSDFARKLFDRVRYLTIDEYQDTNPSQEKLVSLFDENGTQICVVGDADQTIYQFRGSDDGNLTRFETAHNARVIQLKYNYRSTEAIVNIAAQAIAPNHINDPAYMPMRTAKGINRPLEYEEGDTVWKEFADYDEEMDFIIDRIKELHSLDIPYTEMAVLFRVRQLNSYGNTLIDYQSELVKKMQEAGIPYIVEGLNQLFTTKEYKAARGIFEYLYDKYGYHPGTTDAYDETNAREVLKALWNDIGHKIETKGLDKAVNGLAKIDLSGKKFGHECNMQQIYQDFIGCLSVIAEVNRDAEKIMYNLGKFSKLIADFELLYFKESPQFKITQFHKHLEKVADGLYPEGADDNEYIRSESVRLMTVHQAKGLEFTAVFMPALNKDMLPHIVSFQRDDKIYSAIDAIEDLGSTYDEPWIPNRSGYNTTEESERNIFYVALTRSKKYLFLSYAHEYAAATNMASSTFLDDLMDKAKDFLKEYDGSISYTKDHLPEIVKASLPITLNFSLLSNYFDCPYRFKLSNFYGFVQPYKDVQGYGKAMHEIMMHIHRAWIEGKKIDEEWIKKTVNEAVYLPFANTRQIQNAIASAKKCAKAYVLQNEKDSDRVEAAEMDINIEMGDGVSVNGRIDLVLKAGSDGKPGETMIVDLKCAGKDAEQCLNAEQLKIYAIGYKEMTGRNADHLMIYNLDKPDGSANKKEAVNEEMLKDTREEIKKAADNIRRSELPCDKEADCDKCYVSNLCGNNHKQTI